MDLNTTQTDTSSPEIQQTNDYSDIYAAYGNNTESSPDKNVMGDAVEAVQNGKSKQQQQIQKAIQKIKLADKEYDPTELEKIVKDFPNVKKGMHQAFEEKAKYEKMLKQLEHKFGEANDPEKFLKLRFNDQQIEEALLKIAEQKTKELQMSPEQRQMTEAQRENERLKQQIQQQEQAKQQHYMQMLEQHHMNEYDQQFKAQIVSRNLPYTKMDLREMANLIAIGNQKGVDMDFATAAEQMLENRRSGLKMYLNELVQKDPDGNLLEEWLKDTGVIKTIQKRLINKVKTPGQPVKRIQTDKPSTPVPSSAKMTPQEWRQFIKSR